MTGAQQGKGPEWVVAIDVWCGGGFWSIFLSSLRVNQIPATVRGSPLGRNKHPNSGLGHPPLQSPC